jgi:hypothetical protein
VPLPPITINPGKSGVTSRSRNNFARWIKDRFHILKTNVQKDMKTRLHGDGRNRQRRRDRDRQLRVLRDADAKGRVRPYSLLEHLLL